MSTRTRAILVGLIVLLLLAVSLGVRLVANSDRAAGGSVPAPGPFRMADLEIPHWSHQKAREWPGRASKRPRR